MYHPNTAINIVVYTKYWFPTTRKNPLSNVYVTGMTMVLKNLHRLCLFFIEDNKKFYKKTNTTRELLSRRS